MVVIIVGWIILAVVLCVLLLLLFTPLGVSADYAAGSFKASARVMCFDLPLFPRPAKQETKAPAKKREKKPKPEKPEAEKKPKPPLVTREMIPDLLKLVLRTLSRFRRKLTVNRFLLHITVGGGDPYSAVMAYGTINYAMATVGSAAGHAFNVRSSDVQTGIDFSADNYTVEAGSDYHDKPGAHYRRSRSGRRWIPQDKTQCGQGRKGRRQGKEGTRWNRCRLQWLIFSSRA